MASSYRFLVLVVVCVAVAVALLIPRGQVASADPKAPPEPPAGRYQLFKNPSINRLNHDCLLDTATGRVWLLEFDEKQRWKWVLAVEAPK
jgi:hypothetical protein